MIPTELISSFQRNDAILFIGAGLSIGAGLPGWADLIRPLAQSVGSRWPAHEADLTSDYLLVAAQYYENQQGRNALISYLREKLDLSGIQPTVVHQLVASLPVQVIFTTNYDDLIEQALRQAGKRPNVIIEEPELAFWREQSVNLVKLNGDLLRPASIVITQRDFNTYFSSRLRLTERLRTTLESKTALFLGYSLQDPFFNQIWDHIGLDFGKLRRCGYAVLFDVDPPTNDDLRQREIHVINLETKGKDHTAALAEWLQELLEKLELSSQKEKSPSEKRNSKGQFTNRHLRLRQQIDELQKQWQMLTQKLSKLNHDKILETRSDEKMRLQDHIDELTTERQDVERRLNEFEKQFVSD